MFRTKRLIIATIIVIYILTCFTAYEVGYKAGRDIWKDFKEGD